MKADLITIDADNPFEVMHTDKVQPFIPAGFHSVIKFSQLIAASGMAPKGLETADKCAVAIFHGMEVGLTPMASLQSIAVINGRPSIWGDGALAMVRASGLLDDIEETYEGGELWLERPEYDNFGKVTKAGKPNPDFKAICTTTRKNAKRPVTFEFSVLDAMQAGLWNKEGPWRTNPKRMLKFRARGFNLRDEFTDVMRGLVLAEEAQDYDDMRDITPAKDEPPVPEKDAAPKRTRGKAADKNKYQTDDEKVDDGKQIDGEVVKEDAKVDEAKKDEPAAEEKKAEPEAEKQLDDDQPPAPGKNAEKADTGKAAGKSAEKTEPAGSSDYDADGNKLFLEKLFDRIGPDKQLKDHITALNLTFGKAETMAAMRATWESRVKMPNITKGQQEFVNDLRDWHKARIKEIDDKAAAGDEPPAPGGDDDGASFDYSGFLHELDIALGKEETPEGVNRVYSEMLTGPLKANLITDENVEDDLKPMLGANLERVSDFGN